MDRADINNRFEYHPPSNDDVRRAHEEVRAACRALVIRLDDFLPEGREKSLVVTKIEEAMFWANAAIARGQN